MMKSVNASPKLERKTIEKNRRILMKNLCFKLASLIPNQNPREVQSQLAQINRAVTYIIKLQERIEQWKKKKQLLMRRYEINSGKIDHSTTMGSRMPPVLELRDSGSNLEVILISGFSKKFMFNEVISVLEEEGAEVVHASFSVVEDKIFHTIHSHVTSSRIGVEPSRVLERLKELVY